MNFTRCRRLWFMTNVSRQKVQGYCLYYVNLSNSCWDISVWIEEPPKKILIQKHDTVILRTLHLKVIISKINLNKCLLSHYLSPNEGTQWCLRLCPLVKALPFAFQHLRTGRLWKKKSLGFPSPSSDWSSRERRRSQRRGLGRQLTRVWSGEQFGVRLMTADD